MSRFRSYIDPRDDAGNLTGYQEVSDDMVLESLGTIKRAIDNNRYDVGQFKFASFGFKMRNEHGLYSDVNTIQSIFRFRRGGSRFKITWQEQDHQTQCGIAVCGSVIINPEVVVFEGVINDEAAALDIDDQQISFNALGLDSIFPAVETNYASLTNGDLYSEALLTILNQTAITEYLTVSASNIAVGLDQAIDDISKLENTTVKEALDKLLFQSNSVMYIAHNKVYITDRAGGGTSQKTFYGQASNDGIEDIVKISNVATGLNNVFNFWTWKDTALKAEDVTSVTKNGVRKKEISFDEITDTGKRQAVIDAQKDEFGTKKQEFDITVPVTRESLALVILDQVRVDYPTVYQPATYGGSMPLYGTSIYGAAIYPYGTFSITIDSSTPFILMGISIKTKNQTMVLKLKEQ